MQGLYDRLSCISPHRCQGFSPSGLHRCGFLLTRIVASSGPGLLFVVPFTRSTVVAFWGDVLLSARISLWLSCLHCVGLQHFGELEGLSEQRAVGCFRFHASLVAPRVVLEWKAAKVSRKSVGARVLPHE